MASEVSPCAGTPVDASFDSGGVRIRYVQQGAGEPVVLVHSYTSSIEAQWGHCGVLATLARSHRVIALDVRGHGGSDKPYDPAAYGPEMAWDIVRLLDHLDLERAHVVGYSMGAHILAQLLVLDASRVATATLGGASGRRTWTAEQDRQVAIEADEMDGGSLRSQVLRLWPAHRPAPGGDELDALSRCFLKGNDHRALAAIRRSNARQVVATADLAAVRVPVLGIVGSDDPYRAGFAELAAAMPALELVVLQGATHNSAPSHPGFAPAIRSFLLAHPVDAR